MNRKEYNNYRGVAYMSNDAIFEGVHSSNKASGIIGKSKRILGREMYGTLAL